MSVFTIGDYTIQNLNRGWRVTWRPTNSSTNVSLDVDLEGVIRDHLASHLDNIVRILQIFDTAPEKILDDELGQRILIMLPKDDLIPGQDLPDNQIREWHHKHLLQAYNSLHCTKFTYEMVKNRLP